MYKFFFIFIIFTDTEASDLIPQWSFVRSVTGSFEVLLRSSNNLVLFPAQYDAYPTAI